MKMWRMKKNDLYIKKIAVKKTEKARLKQMKNMMKNCKTLKIFEYIARRDETTYLRKSWKKICEIKNWSMLFEFRSIVFISIRLFIKN